MAERKVSIIIPYKDAPQDLRTLLRSLYAQSVLPSEVIIVDSSEEEKNFYFKQDAREQVLRILPRDFDHGETRTLAASRAQGEVLVI